MNSPQSSVGNCLDVQSFINAQPLSRYQWRVVILCFLIVFLDGLDTAAMGFIAPALSQDWGIDRASLGPVMSAALIGMVFGALGSGPLADRFGRKVVLVSAVLVFGGFSLASAYASNVDQLLVLRFLTGLGLGAGMPNATTLLSEYTPERHKSLLVTSMFCGFNLGMAGGGFVSAKLIPMYGWHSLLLIGGVLPLILAVVLLFWLPESARYLVVRNRSVERIRKTLAPIDPAQVAQASSFSVPEQNTVKARNVFAVIFSGTYSTGTLLLWLTYFMGLVIVYLLTSVYIENEHHFALNLAKNKDWYLAEMKHFKQWAEKVGVPWRIIEKQLHDIMDNARSLWPALLLDLPMISAHKEKLREHWKKLHPDFQILTGD